LEKSHLLDVECHEQYSARILLFLGIQTRFLLNEAGEMISDIMLRKHPSFF
jgi:hypothetical protein